MCYTNIATRVTFLSQLAGEKFVELGAEYAIGDELSFLADLCRHSALRKLQTAGLVIGWLDGCTVVLAIHRSRLLAIVGNLFPRLIEILTSYTFTRGKVFALLETLF